MVQPVTPQERHKIRCIVEPLQRELRADSVRVDKFGHARVRRKFPYGQEQEAVEWPAHVLGLLPVDGDAYGTHEFRDAKGFRTLEVKARVRWEQS
jgi:hypothetical protein